MTCTIYAASSDDAEGYGDPLISVSGSDSSSDSPSSAGAPEFLMYKTNELAKFSFEDLD